MSISNPPYFLKTVLTSCFLISLFCAGSSFAEEKLCTDLGSSDVCVGDRADRVNQSQYCFYIEQGCKYRLSAKCNMTYGTYSFTNTTGEKVDPFCKPDPKGANTGKPF